MALSMEQLQEKVWDDAEKANLNLNYFKKVLHEDISALTEDQWLALRKHGFGGSEAGSLMGVGDYANPAKVVMDKLNMLPKKEVDNNKQFMFDVGHYLEPAIMDWFGRKTGFSVFTDRRMFNHPLYPWMLADCDAFCVDANGNTCGLEFKTANPDFKYGWKSGVYGEDAKILKPEYIWQVRHYMAVTNLYRWYICVAPTNRGEDIQIIQVDRNVEAEVQLINKEDYMWNDCVCKGFVPYSTTYKTKIFSEIKKNVQPDGTTITFNEDKANILKELAELKEKKTKLERDVKEIEERFNALKLPLIDELDAAETGVFETGDTRYIVTYKGKNKSESVDKEKLKVVYPDVYQQVYIPPKKAATREFQIKTERK